MTMKKEKRNLHLDKKNDQVEEYCDNPASMGGNAAENNADMNYQYYKHNVDLDIDDMIFGNKKQKKSKK